jgi:hypothetical protein
MPKDKKTEVLRARVEETFARKVERYCRARGWSEAQILREAVSEYITKNPVVKPS